MVKILISVLLFFGLSFLLKTDPSFNQDLGRHLKLGEIIWQTRSIPHTNLFSYTNPNFLFINHHWLFEVVVFLFSKSFGLQILLWIKIIVLLFTSFLILQTSKKNLLFLPIGFLFFHILRERTDFRPEIFSFLFTSITVYVLEKYHQTKTKLIYLLPLIQLIWVNMHIYFFIGLVIQVIYLLALPPEMLKKFRHDKDYKQQTFVLIFSSIFTLINPNFIIGAVYPLLIFGNYGYTIAENQNLFLLQSLNFPDQNFLFVEISILIAFGSIIWAYFKKTLKIKNLLLVISGITLALFNIRSFPYLILLAFPAVIANFGEIKKSHLLIFSNFVVIGLILIEGVFYLYGDYYKVTNQSSTPNLNFSEDGKQALDFVINNNLKAPIFNNFDIGSYITYRGFPEYKVFVDGRPETYPADFFQKIYIPMQENPSIFKEQSLKYGFKTIIFSITDQTPWALQFMQKITADPDWKIVYLDDFIVVLVKSDQTSGLKTVDLNQLEPKTYQYDNYYQNLQLAVFLYNTGHFSSAYKFAQQAYAQAPNNPNVNKLLLSITGKSQYYQTSSNFVFW